MKQILMVFLVVSTLMQGNSAAQDPHFSQFSSSPLSLNPALTGKFFGSFRVAGNYRNQWPSINQAFTTSTISLDMNGFRKQLPSNDHLGFGFIGYNDNSASGAVKFNYASFSTAYHKGLDEDGMHSLGLGFQVTYANMLINTAAIQFEDQLTSAGFTGVSTESFNGLTLKSNYLDLNAGILYNGSTSERNNFYIGVSIYHLNRPKQTFTGSEFLLNPRTTIHAGGYFPISKNANLHFSGLHLFQGAATETMLGGSLQLIANPSIEKPVSLYLGSWVRFQDAIIPSIGVEFNDYRLGFSYDYNSSALKTASQNRGGIELSLIYQFRPSLDKPINCPKF